MSNEFKVGDRVRGKSCNFRGTISAIYHPDLNISVMLESGLGNELDLVKSYEIEHDNWPFKVGDHVEKVSGYKFPGTVVAVFRNLKGEDRYVVECTVPEVAGILHIYNRNQLEKMEG